MTRCTEQHGYILLPVVILLTLVATVAFMLNNESALDSGITSSNLELKQAEYVAQAGLNHALWQTRQQGCGPYSDLTNKALGKDSYTTTLTTDLGSTTSYTIAVDQDSWIRSDQPTNNMASDSKLHIRFEGGTIERPMYRYDLSAIPSNDPVLSARAWFYVSKEHPEGPVDIHRLIADWTETDATWDTMGANMDSTVLATIPTQPTAGVWVAVNLTAQVQAWVNGEPNYGITLNSTSEGTHGDYASREAAQQPYLEVIVGTPPSSPAKLKSEGKLASGISRTIQRHDIRLYQQPSHRMLQTQPGVGKDTMLSDFYNNRNYGDHRLRVSLAGSLRNALVQFDVAAIPVGARVISAQLQLYHTETVTAGIDAGATVHRVNRDWVEGTKSGTGTADGATWDTWDGSAAWGTAGGDYDPAAIASSAITAAIDDWESWDITALVQGWVDGTYDNNGLLLKGSGDVNVSFASRENADPMLHPNLIISYACECGTVCSVPQGSGNILFVVSDQWFMKDGEKAKRALFESWGYTVDLISQWDVSWNFDAKATNNDVVYVSEAVLSTTFGMAPKLAATSLGVVSEEGELNDELGIASGLAWPVGNSFNILDNSHYITRPFAAGNLQIFAAAMEGLTVSGSEAGGLQMLADWGGKGSLIVLDMGAALDGGGTAPGRRVMLPLGRDNKINLDYLNSNGLLIMQRALQWGTGNLGPSISDPIILSTDSAATLGGLDFDDIDLVDYDDGNDLASLFFEGALTTLDEDIDAVHVLANGHILLSTKDAATLGGLSFQDGDLVDYDPGTGSASLFFDESMFSGDENIVSVYLASNGHLVLSTDSDATLGGLSFEDIDLVDYDPATNTASLFFDGSTTTLDEDIDANHVLDNGHIVLSTKDNATLGGLSFDDGDLVDYDTATDTAVLYFDEGRFSANENIISAHIGPGSGELNPATLPIAHWKLDETSGPTAVDSVGGHDGTLINDPAWAGGQRYGALNFDGSNDYIDVPHDDTLSLNDAMTFTAWINASSFGNSYQTIVAKDGGGSASNYWFGTWRRELVFGFFAGGSFREVFTSGLNLQPDTWYHLAAMFDNTADVVVLFVDGVPVHKDEMTFSPSAVKADLSIGRSPDGEYWRGLLDDVRIYDELLSVTEIAELAAPPVYTPVAHWKLDETSGDTAVDSIGGHDGTLANGPSWTAGQLDGGLDFDGSDDHVLVPDSASLDITDAITLSAWIRPNKTGTQYVIRKAQNDSTDGYELSLSTTGKVFFRLNQDTSANTYRIDSTTSYPTDGTTWMHIAGTYDGAVLRLYINGVEEASLNAAITIATNDTDLSLGAQADGSRVIDGVIDDVRLYRDPLSAVDIAALAGAGGGGGPGPGTCNGTFRDEFNAVSFSNNDGTLNWMGDWLEVGESDGPGSNDVRVRDDNGPYQLWLRDKQNGGEGVEREADLSGAAAATLSFEYRRSGLDGTSDYVKLEISSNGAAGPWVELARFQGSATDTAYQSFSQDISAYISAATRIRLITSPTMGSTDTVMFDNIQIQCSP